MARIERRVFCGITRLLDSRAVGLFDSAPGPLQLAEEEVHPGDIALVYSQLAKLGEHKLGHPVPVGVRCGVFTPLRDLGRPDGGSLPKTRVRSEHLVLGATPPRELVLEGLVSCRAGRAPPGHASGHAVQIADAAAGDPLAVLARDFHRTVVPESERRTRQERTSERGSVE